MTKQEKIKFLSRYKAVDKEIDAMAQELSHWRGRAGLVANQWDMPRGKSASNRLENGVERIMELEELINGKIDELTDLRKNIFQAVNSIDDPTLRRLLDLRYIEGKRLEEIAVIMAYGYRHTKRLHNIALDQINMSPHVP